MAAGACTGAPYALVLPLLSFQEYALSFWSVGSAKGHPQRVARRPKLMCICLVPAVLQLHTNAGQRPFLPD